MVTYHQQHYFVVGGILVDLAGEFSLCTIGLPHSTAPCPILEIQSTRLGSDKYKFIGLTRLGFEPMGFKSYDLPKWEVFGQLTLSNTNRWWLGGGNLL